MTDPYRCVACGAYWQPEADGLHHLPDLGRVCRNRSACRARLRLRHDLDKLCHPPPPLASRG